MRVTAGIERVGYGIGDDISRQGQVDASDTDA